MGLRAPEGGAREERRRAQELRGQSKPQKRKPPLGGDAGDYLEVETSTLPSV